MLIFGNSFPKSSNGISEEQSALNINIQLRKVSKIFLVFVWYVIFGRSRFPLRLRWEACMGPMGPGLLGGIEPCSFSSLLELVSELLLSTAGCDRLLLAQPSPVSRHQAVLSPIFVPVNGECIVPVLCLFQLFSCPFKSEKYNSKFKYFTDHS